MPAFLKLSAAAKRTGKSTSTIRRFIKSIAADDRHPDRSQVKPSSQEARQYEKDGIQFTWEVSDELLDREFPPSNQKDTSETQASVSIDKLIATLDETIGQLTNQLGVKDQQLADRAREVEKLQNSLQHAQLVQSQLAQKAGLPSPLSSGDQEGTGSQTITESTLRRRLHNTPIPLAATIALCSVGGILFAIQFYKLIPLFFL